MTTLLLLAAATLAVPHPPVPTLPAAAVAHALRCAATNAVLAAMLDSAPDASPGDRASAATFRAEAESWRLRSGETPDKAPRWPAKPKASRSRSWTVPPRTWRRRCSNPASPNAPRRLTSPPADPVTASHRL